MTKQVHREMFDKAKYASIIKTHIPNTKESSIIWHEDGWDFVVAVVNNKAFRFPRRKDYESKLPIEAEFIKQFAPSSPVTIPQLKLCTDPEIGNYVFYSFIPGVHLKRKLSETFSKDNRMQIASQLGKFLTAFHSFSVEKAKEIGIEEINSLQSWTERLETVKKLVFPHLTKEQKDWTIQIFTNFIDLIKEHPIQNTVTHADIMPEHIIVNPETQMLSGIIDFGDIVIADPAYDFTFLNKYEKNFLDEAYKSYGLPRDPYFETRRQFYEDRLVVTNLEHSIKVGDPIWIERHKEEFVNYLLIIHS